MTSFQIAITPNKRAAGRFISKVRRALQRALVIESERSGLSQSDVARRIGVHRSVISRELNGRQDITLGRVAELAWAIGREIEFELVVPQQPDRANFPATSTGAIDQSVRIDQFPEAFGITKGQIKSKNQQTLLESIL